MTFKAGDRVVVNDHCHVREWRGIEGTVVDSYFPGPPDVVKAKMDTSDLGWVSHEGHLSLGAYKWTLLDNTLYEPEDWS